MNLKAIIIFLFHHCRPPPPPGFERHPSSVLQQTVTDAAAIRSHVHARARSSGRTGLPIRLAILGSLQPAERSSLRPHRKRRCGRHLSVSYALTFTLINPAGSNHNIQSWSGVARDRRWSPRRDVPTIWPQQGRKME